MPLTAGFYTVVQLSPAMAVGLSDTLWSDDRSGGNGGCGGSDVGKARAVQETVSCVMPRKHAILVAAAKRVAVARRLIADQQDLIARLRALKQPTTDAEAMLQTYRSAPRHLEDHEDKIKQGLKAGPR